MRTYGINYTGSKSRIAAHIVHTITKITGYQRNDSEVIFYDLFGGGFAMSHYALEKTRWKVVYNEPYNFIADVIEHFVVKKGEIYTEFIDREEFMKVCNLEQPTEEYPAWKIGFIKSVYSYNGNLQSYAGQADLEEQYKKLHQGLQNETTYFQSTIFKKMRIRTNYMKRLGIKKELARLMQRMERFEALVFIDAKRLTITRHQFDELPITGDKVVIYCDPPYYEASRSDFYTGTAANKSIRDSLVEYFLFNKHHVFISEFTFPVGRVVMDLPLVNNYNKKYVSEKLFYNK